MSISVQNFSFFKFGCSTNSLAYWRFEDTKRRFQVGKCLICEVGKAFSCCLIYRAQCVHRQRVTGLTILILNFLFFQNLFVFFSLCFLWRGKSSVADARNASVGTGTRFGLMHGCRTKREYANEQNVFALVSQWSYWEAVQRYVC